MAKQDSVKATKANQKTFEAKEAKGVVKKSLDAQTKGTALYAPKKK